MRNALIQGEQVPRREIHHPLGQVKPDMAAKRVHRDSACRGVLMHARIRLHSDQHNTEIRVLYKRLRTSPRGGQPRFILVQLRTYAMRAAPAKTFISPDVALISGLDSGSLTAIRR